MLVRFIHHSCFVVETDSKVLIFDYFEGGRVNGYQFGGKIPEYDRNTPIYMFASHCHRDHFDMDILRWIEKYPNIKYILSKDIRISPNFLKKHGIDPKVRERILFAAPAAEYELDDMKIRTLRSTDAGVAYYVRTDGTGIYHAGDLNMWVWDGAGDLINGQVKSLYRSQIRKLEGFPIEAAFVPMDPRLGKNEFLGIDYFMKNTECEHVFPMHMWQDYSGIARYKKRITNRDMAERIMDITEENQEFVL